MFGIFSLEKRVLEGVAAALSMKEADIARRLSAFEERIALRSLQLDKLEMEINSRLSRLENLLVDELSEKEKARDELIKQRRLNK